MTKYRLLSGAELKELEKEFIEYLILNGIAAEDWESIKQNNKPKAEQIIELFSDVVFESVLRKINFLEYRDQTSVRAFQCLPDKLVVVSMEASDNNEVDFTNQSFIQNAISNPPTSLKIFTANKLYTLSREAELFEMLQTGCVITNGNLFKTMSMMLIR